MKATMPDVSPEVRALTDDELVGRLHNSHVAVVGVMRAALRHARYAGELLAEMKYHRIPRGSWLLWLKDHRITPSTAANYTRVFEKWNELEPHLQDAASLTLTEALELLAGPRRAREQSPEQQELPDGALYTVPVIADWISFLRSMPIRHRQRSREWLIRLREEVDAAISECD